MVHPCVHMVTHQKRQSSSLHVFCLSVVNPCPWRIRNSGRDDFINSKEVLIDRTAHRSDE